MAIFSNRATLTYSGGSTDSNVVFGEILEDLTAVKSAVEEGYAPGEIVTYTLALRNTGATALTGLTITDDLGGTAFGAGTVYPLTALPAGVQVFVDGVAQAATVTAGPPMTITGVNIPAGSDAVIVYQARANTFANPNVGGTIVNTATITGGTLATPIVATNTLAADSAAALTIAKALSPSQVVDNGRVTYTFTITNTGTAPVTVTDNAVITDTFSPILTDLAVTFGTTPWTAGTQYAYNQATGLFSTNAGQITVPAATYTQDPATGTYSLVPGVVTLTVTGTI